MRTLNDGDEGDVYEGFVVDLAHAISAIMGFNFTIVPTDGYGSVGKDGKWNGMIRELLEEVLLAPCAEKGAFGCCANALFPPNGGSSMNDAILSSFFSQRADIAMGDLTISYEREQVVDFSMPFLDLGIISTSSVRK